MDNKSVKKETISGIFWRFSESSLSQIINFIVSTILARLLLPEDYGIVALVSVFTALCDKLIVSGLSASLIQKKDADDRDFSTIFFFSLATALLLYGILFLTAPLIANFFEAYNRRLLIDVIRVMGLQLIIVAISSVQNAYVSKTMQFRRFFWSTLGGIIISAIIGIWMAYNGFGVWALVAQNLINMFCSTLVLWFTARWRPTLHFSFKRFKALYAYGWKIFAASIIKVLYNDLRTIVIGKYYSSAQLAYYSKGQSFPQLIESNITRTIDAVLFPAMSQKQSSKEHMLSMLRRSVQVSSFLLMPMLVGLAATAAPLVEVLLTAKWLPCVFFLQVLSFSFLLAPIEIENLQTIKAIGRSDIVLKLEIIKKSVGIILLIIAAPIGVEAIAISLLVGNFFAAIVNGFPNKKLIGYSYRKQIADVSPPIVMSAVMYASVFCVSLLNLAAPILLMLEIFVGAVVYLLLSIITRNESFKYILSIIKGFAKRK
jgi:O-antigen/teichoic acid export membrane protein